jgi:Flp pilus assembly protein TadG
MATPHLLQRLYRTARGFAAAHGGNITITFALAIVPIFGLVGAAVDYSRANSAKAALQSALDSTALMLSKEAPGLTEAQRNEKASAYFNAMFTHADAKNIQVAATYNSATSTLTMSGSAKVDATFSRVIGQDKMPIGASTTIKWGMSRLRVALALDNTGSMGSAGKLGALKTATKGLLTTLQAAAVNPGDVYVSIIPFNRDVNVGASNYNANWIDWTNWDVEHTAQPGNPGWGCLFGWCWKAGVGLVPQGTVSNHNTWNGCVMDRGSNSAPGVTADYDRKVDLPVAGNNATLFPAHQYVDNDGNNMCPVQMKGLSYDWTAMNTLVDSMTANGNTNQPIGLVWAWQSLVGGGPLTMPPMDPNYPYNKIIILMSDGLNTQDRWYTNANPIDNRMYGTGTGLGTCKNIKDAGITIYAVQVNTDGDPVSTLLQNCASDATKFFHLTSANQMVATFNQIGTNLAKLRIAQ